MQNKTSTPLMLIYLVLLYVIRSNAISSNSCPDDSVRLVINSRRNETNHRNVQVEVSANRPIQSVKEDDNDFNLIIDQNSNYCQGREIISWKVNIDGKKVLSTPPKGYEYKPGLGYYKLYREPRNWDKARKVCEQDGAHIIIIDSENELNMMKQWITKLPRLPQHEWNHIQWAGFHDHFTEGEYNTLLVMSTPPKGYEYKSGLGYYKLYREPRNWDEARKVCEQDGAHIIIIDSENELNMMKQWLTKLPNLSQYTWDNAQWAGFHDHFTEGEYTTLLGEPLSTTWYKVWLPGEPRNEARPPDQGSHCEGFFDFKLDGVPCSGKIPFICELI